MRQMVSSSINVVLQLARHSDGTAAWSSFSEITGMESGVISMQDIFVFDRHGMDEEGNSWEDMWPRGLCLALLNVAGSLGCRCPIYSSPRRTWNVLPLKDSKNQHFFAISTQGRADQ